MLRDSNRPGNLTPPDLYQRTAAGLVPVPRVCCPAAEPAPCRGCAAEVGIDDDTAEFDVLGELASEPAVDHGYEPTPADWAALAEARDEAAARRHLDRAEPLGAAVLRQVAFYRSWCNTTGRLLAQCLETLAADVRSTGAASAEEHEARDEILRGDR